MLLEPGEVTFETDVVAAVKNVRAAVAASGTADVAEIDVDALVFAVDGIAIVLLVRI